MRRIEAAFRDAIRDPSFIAELDELLTGFVGRPTALYRTRRLLASGGPKLYLKREDLAWTGGSYINAALGQACWRGGSECGT